MKNLTALIFDLDGVLIDSEPLHERAKRVVFERYGLAVPASVYDTFLGKTDRDVIEHVVREYGSRTLDAAELIAHKQRAFADLHGELQPIPGALPFLQAARSRYRLALTTSAVPANQQRAFQKFDLDAYFDIIVTADDITRAKPDPEPYRITVEKLGCEPAACLVLEDSVNGVRSARAAGCRVVGLTTSFPASALEEAGAHFTAGDYAALSRRLGLPAPE